MLMFKILVSLIVGLLGGYYFWRGIKTQNTKMILVGIALTIASYFVFSGGDSDQDTKALMNNLMQTTPNPQQP